MERDARIKRRARIISRILRVFPAMPGVQRLQGRGIEEQLRDQDRNRSPLNQYENRDYIVIGLRFTAGAEWFDNKSECRIFTNSRRCFQCVGLTCRWHSGGAGATKRCQSDQVRGPCEW